jgi:hypothetical protein
MENKPVVQITAGMPPSDSVDAEKFYRWLDNVHVPNLMKFPGLNKAANYKRIEVEHPFKNEVEYPYYITIFEFKDLNAYNESLKSPEVKHAVDVGFQTWGPSTGRKKIWLATYEEVKSFKK